jgi:hypothetical protein
LDAIKAYIETALRIAEIELQRETEIKRQEHLSAVIIGLKIALDQFTNEY